LPEVQDWANFIAELHKEKTRRYTALLQSGDIQLRPGVRRLITEARAAGVRLAIATTSRLENALALLNTALGPNSPEWFDVIAAGDIVPNKKPAADIYHYVLDKMALPAQQCLVIEDTEHGLMAAKGAGLTTVITANNYTQNQDFAAAALVLSDLGEPDRSGQVLSGADLPKGYFDIAIAEQLLQS
jgi:HAD superfamily hydrolase (TIGR01509 family)